MTDLLVPVVVWLNALANGLGMLLAPVALLPGWLSATLVAVVTGALLLLAFKYTSNQRALERVRRDIKANLLALQLFKESVPVSLRAQGCVLLGALRLFLLALVPMLVLAVPVSLLLGQLSLWYQARPLKIGEEAVVTLRLAGAPGDPWPDVHLEPADGVDTVVGPVRVRSQREVCWNLRAKRNGTHRLVFLVDGRPVDKELAVGDGFMPVSLQRPERHWSEALRHPREGPPPPDSPVRSIAVDFSPRDSYVNGTDWWVGYWFGVSLLSGFALRRVFDVKL